MYSYILMCGFIQMYVDLQVDCRIKAIHYKTVTLVPMETCSLRQIKS